MRAFDVRVPAGLKVAYVTGAGEEGPAILSQLGITPSVLTADSLAGANLSRYDVIVTGIRAYEVRPDLAASNARLLEYVRGGGTLIVQYNKYELVEGRFTPFPITMASPHDRVTDEAAPVRVRTPPAVCQHADPSPRSRWVQGAARHLGAGTRIDASRRARCAARSGAKYGLRTRPRTPRGVPALAPFATPRPRTRPTMSSTSLCVISPPPHARGVGPRSRTDA